MKKTPIIMQQPQQGSSSTSNWLDLFESVSCMQASFIHQRMQMSELLEWIMETPDFQRMMDEDHVNEIIAYNDNYYLYHSRLNILGSISLGKLMCDGYKILDGQHRAHAYRKLYDKYGDFYVDVDIYERSTMEELIDIYDRINRNKPVPMLTTDYIETTIVNETLRLFDDKWKDFIKPSKHPQAPNINLDKLHKAIVCSEIIQKCHLHSAIELFKLCVELNLFFISIPFDKLHEKQHELGITLKNVPVFILGYFKEFEWLGFIIKHVCEHLPYEQLEMKSLKNIANIPKRRRQEVWHRDCGLNTMIGQCYICEHEIRIEDFEAGHVIAKAFGGSNELDNLRAICKECNRDMGTMNLETYKTRL